MTATAAQIAAAIRRNLPHVTTGRLHKLLYFAQGHHLAWRGQPLFADVVVALDDGPAVPTLTHHDQGGDHGEAELNTVGLVCSRYGGLSLRDLQTLATNAPPWRLASATRPPGTAAPIKLQWMADHFRSVDHDPEEPVVDAAALQAMLAQAKPTPLDPNRPDDYPRLKEWLARDPQPAEKATAHSA